jgi:RNA polymerase sigma-70 factor (ECF subfamily)
MSAESLGASFLAALTAAARSHWAGLPGLEGLLDAVASRARSERPTVALAPSRFVAALARSVSEGPFPTDALAAQALLEGLGVGDLWLAAACEDRQPVALEAFDALCQDVVPAALRSLKISAWEIDEVSQRVRQHLLVGDGTRPGRLVEYVGRGALRSWLRAVALRSGLNWLQQQKAQPVAEPSNEEERLVEAGLAEAPELAYMREVYRGAFHRAFRRALQTGPAEDQVLLRQYHLDGLTLAELGSLYRRHEASISRRLSKARAALRARTRAALNEELGVTDSEIDSIFRLLGSKLDFASQDLPPA